MGGVSGREEHTDSELNFAAEWQRQADLLNNLSRSDRDRLEANLRQTLGKKKDKKGASKKGGDKWGSKQGSVPVSAGSDRGFGAAVAGRGERAVPQASVCGFQREAGGGVGVEEVLVPRRGRAYPGFAGNYCTNVAPSFFLAFQAPRLSSA